MMGLPPSSRAIPNSTASTNIEGELTDLNTNSTTRSEAPSLSRWLCTSCSVRPALLSSFAGGGRIKIGIDLLNECRPGWLVPNEQPTNSWWLMLQDLLEWTESKILDNRFAFCSLAHKEFFGSQLPMTRFFRNPKNSFKFFLHVDRGLYFQQTPQMPWAPRGRLDIPPGPCVTTFLCTDIRKSKAFCFWINCFPKYLVSRLFRKMSPCESPIVIRS